MKKVLIVVLLFFICPLNILAISAESAIVLDQDSNRVLYKKNIDEQKLIASTTKIMTCIVALENGKLSDEITVDEAVLKAYGSAIYIELGEKISLEDLLYGLMLRSGNDAAIVISNYFNNKKIDFIKKMNDKAKQLNMTNTVFYNSHGLEENDGKANLSTAYDMALLMSYAMKNNDFKKIVSTKNYTAKSDKKTYSWRNKNKLLFNYKYCNGGKTGYTKLAKRTLVTSATKENKKLVVVTLNDRNDFEDHKNLYEEYFEKYSLIKVIDKKKFKIRNETFYNEANFYVKKDYQMLLNDIEKDNVKINIVLEKNENYKNNQVIGKAQVVLNDKTIYEENIYIKNKKIKKNKTNLWEKIKNIFK